MNLKALALAFALPILTAGCSNFTLFPGVHRISIQQGNMVDQEMVDQLEPGMTRAQVRFVLGTPLIADTFDQERWEYHYLFEDGNGNLTTKKFSVFFADDKLDSFEGNIGPSDETSIEESNS